MGVHISDFGWLYFCVAHRVHHDAIGAFAILGGLGDVVGVAAHSIADDLSQNIRSAAAGKFQFFENQNSCALANYKTVARRIPRPACLFGGVIADRKGAHGGKTAYTHGSDRRFRAARDHGVRITTSNDLERVAD